MPKFIVFSDIHIHNYSQFALGDTRVEICLQILKEILEYGERNNTDFYLFLGDWYEKKSYLNPSIYNKTNQIINNIVTKPIYSVIGHHDSYINDLDSYTMKSNKWVYLLPKEPFNIKGIRIRGYHFWLEHEENVNLDNCDLALFHFNTLLDRDRQKNNQVLELYGHIHNPASMSERVHIIGSPLYHDFGDNPAIERGFMEIDFNESSFNLKRIPLKSKKFITVTSTKEIVDTKNNYYRLITDSINTYKKFINTPNITVKYISKREQNTEFEKTPYLLNPKELIRNTNPDTLGIAIYNKFIKDEIRN